MNGRIRPAALRSLFTIAALAAIVIAACGPGGPSPTPSPSPGPTPTPGPTGEVHTLAELKYAIVDRFGLLWYCDPDFWPIQREDEQKLAIERFGEVRADAEAFAAILAHLALNVAGDDLTDAQKLAIYREWKVLNAIALEPIGNDRYRFDHLAQPPAGGAEGTRTAGVIGAAGAIEIEQQAPAGEPVCPICLARGTRIETPDGPLAVDRLRIGDAVWTLDADGRRVRGIIVAVGSTPAPASHEVVRLSLADGRTVTASAGHPLADGRRLGDLRLGDVVDGAAVVATVRQPYRGGETFDIAVSGPTGLYLVDGIALGSTLRPSAGVHFPAAG